MNITKAESDKLTRQFTAELNSLILDIRDRAMSQFTYNLETNIPNDRLEPGEAVNQAIQQGVVGAMSSRNEFGIVPSVKLAFAILEDVNAHTEAKVLTPFIQATA